MADPISIISVVAVAAHSVNKTLQFVESIKGAPDAVKTLSDDLKAIKDPLHDLSKLSSDLHVYDTTTREDIEKNLGPAVSSCQDTVTKIEDLLKPFVRSDGSPKSSTWKRMSFGFKEHKVLILRSQLEACKSSLSLAAIRVNITIQNKHKQQTDKTGRDVRRLMRHFQIDTSSVADTEFLEVNGRLGFRHDITQWLSETSTVIADHDLEHIRSPDEERLNWGTGLRRQRSYIDSPVQERTPLLRRQWSFVDSPVREKATPLAHEHKIGPIVIKVDSAHDDAAGEDGGSVTVDDFTSDDKKYLGQKIGSDRNFSDVRGRPTESPGAHHWKRNPSPYEEWCADCHVMAVRGRHRCR